jgi:hypothetical protein
MRWRRLVSTGAGLANGRPQKLLDLLPRPPQHRIAGFLVPGARMGKTEVARVERVSACLLKMAVS